MADNEGKEEPAPRGNEWEVVSLTASTYAAAPGPEQVEMADAQNSDLVGESEAETSRLMFMSGHFVFPPSQHENLPLESESKEIRSVHESVDDVNQLIADEGNRSETKEQENINSEGLAMSGEFPGIQIFDEKGNILTVGDSEFGKGKELHGLDLVDKEQSLYNSATLSSIHSEPTMGGSTTIEANTGTPDLIEPYDQDEDSVGSNLPKYTAKSFDGCNLPCGAWWKRRAASIYAHAKEANTFWSIFVAAAVMGLVILGQRWQQERWQVLQLKWHSINDERMGRMLGPLTRLKDVIVGGPRRSSFIAGGNSVEH
ncbi:hypothetical protein M9H77_33235 [Catharanthus roseus]|uniref:Uncharacterized protein n=1 Tax=Catharanthus roseus TaxID=4058 RepID=A0ACB9ZLB1_CATRO|nr:hypothetical protein M9H77_33235 [Catharanthus roseus]